MLGRDEHGDEQGDEMVEEEELVRPDVSPDKVRELVARLYGINATSVTELGSYDDQNFHVETRGHVVPEPSSSSSSPSVVCPHGYVLKVTNSADSRHRAGLVEAQTQAVRFLGERGFPVPAVVPTTDGRLMAMETLEGDGSESRFIVRLFTFLPGTLLEEVEPGDDLLGQMGRTLARMNRTLHEEFHEPCRAALCSDGRWGLQQAHLIAPFVDEVEDVSLRATLADVVHQFRERVLPNLRHFRPSINHSDFHDQNLLVCPKPCAGGDGAGGWELCGILDFSDACAGPLVLDAAVAMADVVASARHSDLRQALRAAGAFLAAFEREAGAPLTEAERGALFILVAARLAQSAVLAERDSRTMASGGPAGGRARRVGAFVAQEAARLGELWAAGEDEAWRCWRRGSDPPDEPGLPRT
ncbi:hydroxylysine kinase-like [Lampetra fluviatilis]